MIRPGPVLSCCLFAALLSGCGLLFPPDPPGFREYALEGVTLEQAQSIVRDVTARFYAERFGGGFSVDWDPEQRNLKVSPVYEPTRRMTLYIHLLPGDERTMVEMLALVEHMTEAGTNVAGMWGRPMQDVHFEEKLYEAFLVELLARQEVGGTG